MVESHFSKWLDWTTYRGREYLANQTRASFREAEPSWYHVWWHCKIQKTATFVWFPTAGDSGSHIFCHYNDAAAFDQLISSEILVNVINLLCSYSSQHWAKADVLIEQKWELVCVLRADLIVWPLGPLFISPGLLQSIGADHRQDVPQSDVTNRQQVLAWRPLLSRQRHCTWSADAPLTAVSWTLSKQRDWFAQSTQSGLHLGVISGNRDLPRSSPPLEGSERLLLPLIDPLLKVQSLSCSTASWETSVSQKERSKHTEMHLQHRPEEMLMFPASIPAFTASLPAALMPPSEFRRSRSFSSRLP